MLYIGHTNKENTNNSSPIPSLRYLIIVSILDVTPVETQAT